MAKLNQECETRTKFDMRIERALIKAAREMSFRLKSIVYKKKGSASCYVRHSLLEQLKKDGKDFYKINPDIFKKLY